MSIKKIQKFSKEDIDLYGISFYRLNNQFYVPLILKGNNKTATITITIQAEQISKKDLKDLSSVDEHFHSSARNIGIKKDAPQDFKNKLIGAIWDFLCTCPVSVYNSPKKLWVYDGWLFEVKHEYKVGVIPQEIYNYFARGVTDKRELPFDENITMSLNLFLKNAVNKFDVNQYSSKFEAIFFVLVCA